MSNKKLVHFVLERRRCQTRSRVLPFSPPALTIAGLLLRLSIGPNRQTGNQTESLRCERGSIGTFERVSLRTGGRAHPARLGTDTALE